MRILIRNGELDHRKTDLLIEGNSIIRIQPCIEAEADKTIDASGKAIVPGMFNAHTHAAMTLMRGYADDMPLMPWLTQKIWPLEKKLTEEDVYWGVKLACLEMIKTGTTTFVDMYHFFSGTARAVDEMGLRAMLSFVGFDFGNSERASIYKKEVQDYHQTMKGYPTRISFAMGPHAIYSVSKDLLKWIRDYAADNGLRIQTHLSETKSEVENAIKAFGLRPVQYLKSIGFLGPDVSFAHALYLNNEEIQILADCGCQVIHNPASNLKLASGNHFLYRELTEAGVPIALGTDGTSSGNNLDMYETMKLASLTGKAAYSDPTVWNAADTFAIATQSAEKLTGFNTGKIEEGYLADLCLVNLKLPELTPNFNLISNLVYSANGNCVDTVICDGKILMENRYVPGEEEIMQKAAEVAGNLAAR